MSDEGLSLLRRGSIVLVRFDPAIGSEAAKTRAAVVVSNNTADAAVARTGRGVITVVPVTGNVTRVHPFQVLLRSTSTGLSKDSKAQVEQVRAVSVDRVVRVIGWVPSETMAQVDAAIRLHLAV